MNNSVKIVSKGLDSEKLPFNVELIIRSLSDINITKVNAVSIDSAGYIGLNSENLAVLSLVMNEDIDNILPDKKFIEVERFIASLDNRKTDMSLIDFSFSKDSIFNNDIFGIVNIFQSNESSEKYNVFYYIKRVDDYRELYVPQFMLHNNYNSIACIYVAEKFLNNNTILCVIPESIFLNPRRM